MGEHRLREMKKEKYNIAIVGATGLVGETLIDILVERTFPVDEVALLASARSAGKRLQFGNKSVTVKDLAEFDFSNTDVAFFSAGGSISAEYAPKAAEQGAVVIDNTSHFRRDEDIPLVVSEVNPEAIAGYKNRGIIANPNCSTMQIMPPLKAIADKVGLKRLNLATYQAVSGAGKTELERLAKETANIMNAKGIEGDTSRQYAFNAIPQIDVLLENGYTKEEMKMVWESRKILQMPDLQVNPTAVRIPAFFGHSIAVHAETEQKISANETKELLEQTEGVTVVDNHEPFEFPTAVSHAANNDDIFVGRIREDVSYDKGINMWVVADNIRKGAALNAVQVGEILIRDHL